MFINVNVIQAEKEQAALNAENHLISHPPGGHPAGPYPAGSYPSGAYLAQGTPQPPTSFPAQFTPTHRYVLQILAES